MFDFWKKNALFLAITIKEYRLTANYRAKNVTNNKKPCFCHKTTPQTDL